jgi:hypothetical protein
MKTYKLIGAAMLLFVLSLAIFNVTNAKTNNKIDNGKKRHHKKPQFQYYLEFTTASGRYEVHGLGGQFSGNLNWGYEACINDTLHIGGVGTPASGTYSYNTTTDVMSVNCTGVNFGRGVVTYSGPVTAYDSSPIDLRCDH